MTFDGNFLHVVMNGIGSLFLIVPYDICGNMYALNQQSLREIHDKHVS